MNSKIEYCEKFILPFTKRTIKPNWSYSSNVKVIDYDNIKVENLTITKVCTKTKHLVIVKIEVDTEHYFYIYSDTLDNLFKSLTAKERQDFKDNYELYNSSIGFVMYVSQTEGAVQTQRYVINDWGIICIKNNVIIKS